MKAEGVKFRKVKQKSDGGGGVEKKNSASGSLPLEEKKGIGIPESIEASWKN